MCVRHLFTNQLVILLYKNVLIDCIFPTSRLIEDICEVPKAISSVFTLSSAIRPLVADIQDKLSTKLTSFLLDHHSLHRHCQVVRAVYLMEAGDMMHEFYSDLFAKVRGNVYRLRWHTYT